MIGLPEREKGKVGGRAKLGSYSTVAALPRFEEVTPQGLKGLNPTDLVDRQQQDEELSPNFARVGEGSEEMGGKEQRQILYRLWRES